ncbi:hypothetical protein RFI_09703 [Reticulomyxa filosa]|uniref:Uncharacterized protein n=1 Tax=Reticulomyxa filosa TaxID=46433 RepID=X6NQ02_RETFI|nr:hypothetical protein RFI_09703 [Reticulomyxa filosa]|eukprot:ETO27427.1 hypothetical protein RFI_09703 [Reticulomyxa filosa]
MQAKAEQLLSQQHELLQRFLNLLSSSYSAEHISNSLNALLHCNSRLQSFVQEVIDHQILVSEILTLEEEIARCNVKLKKYVNTLNKTQHRLHGLCNKIETTIGDNKSEKSPGTLEKSNAKITLEQALLLSYRLRQCHSGRPAIPNLNQILTKQKSKNILLEKKDDLMSPMEEMYLMYNELPIFLHPPNPQPDIMARSILHLNPTELYNHLCTKIPPTAKQLKVASFVSATSDRRVDKAPNNDSQAQNQSIQADEEQTQNVSENKDEEQDEQNEEFGLMGLF